MKSLKEVLLFAILVAVMVIVGDRMIDTLGIGTVVVVWIGVPLAVFLPLFLGIAKDRWMPRKPSRW